MAVILAVHFPVLDIGACDTWAALSDETAGSVVLVAKNSDRTVSDSLSEEKMAGRIFRQPRPTGDPSGR
jgi:hypothetical protein